MLLETFMNAYHVCIHKLLCLHIMRRKKNIRFLSLHNILGMFSFVASDVCFIKTDTLYIGYHLCIAGLELARVPRVPGTRRNSEHHLRHPLFFEVLNANWHLQSSFYVTSGTLSFKFLTQALYSVSVLMKQTLNLLIHYLVKSI